MVNNGASGACHACKQKRKKCDETRPSCLRCARASRSCPGYELSKDRKFIIYGGESNADIHTPPKAINSSNCNPISNLLEMIDWPRVEKNARLTLFHDYCIPSSDRDLSRGYLHGLELMIAKAGPDSELEKACTIVALTSLGKKIGYHLLLKRAENLYSLMLRSFRLSISNEAVFSTIESLITATLLGLYEIITGTDENQGGHAGHAKGVSAMLVSKFSPFDLICDGKLFQISSPILLEDLEVEVSGRESSLVVNKLPQRFSVMCTPFSYQLSTTIDYVYIRTGPLLQKAELLFRNKNAPPAEVRDLKMEAEKLKDAYIAWRATVPKEWTPRPVGYIAFKEDDAGLPEVGYWPCTAYSYYDPYVAHIWNSYRKASLLILYVIIECHDRLDNGLQLDPKIHKYKSELTDGIISSIPYLLGVDLQAFVENSSRSSPPLVPGRQVGGLLSMFPLYVLSTVPIVDENLRTYGRSCLAWIGARMGIGQATILSNCTSPNQFDYTTEARVIIWTGMLI